ncbi:hypothetical protein [Sinorhizobium sp. GL28]|uniref:hypothetical protein n=1 Tax=Sinorhizobium sp. GL28 TaxID=1358418 RepID=UPI00071C962C|nr:hypothetical protein [Sinorhizobium sp. GL28]KSV93167.1 hypothetical protein N184_21555 [Sinorhizobium sp. GL28]
MSGCDKLHPAFRDIAAADDARRRRPRPSLVEALAAAVVLLLVFAVNFDRWTGDASTGAPSALAAFDETGPELDQCRGAFLPGDC